MNAVDTNILLYSLDASEPAKRAIAQVLLRELRSPAQRTILPWQVLCEVTSQLRYWTGKRKISNETATNYIQTFRSIFPIRTPRAAVFDYALELFEQFSLLIATCSDIGLTGFAPSGLWALSRS